MPAALTSVAMPRLSIAVFSRRMQSRPSESQGITKKTLANRGIRTVSSVAAVIHAASDQALREPEQANETGRDDQQSQGFSGMSGVKSYSARERAILELLAL